MTENEKRILTFLSKKGPLSKKALAGKGKMGWATVVKMITRLEEEGIVHCVGTDSQPIISGKNPAIYDLTNEKPLAVGVDVSYSETNIVLTNLRQTIVEQHTWKTPENPNKRTLKEFLVSICSQTVKNMGAKQRSLTGIGIGVPRWLITGGTTTFSALAKELSAELQTPVRLEECTARNYAMYKKWVGKAFPLNNFILMTIRNGVGAGIFYHGDLIRGNHGIAGELGHLTIIDHGDLCRCGKHGCLETLINQDILYREYVQKVLHEPLASIPLFSDSAIIHKGLFELFSLAQQGHPEAVTIIEKAARSIGVGIAALLMILDIPNVMITGNFGPDGAVIIPYIEQVVSRRIISGIDYSIEYHPLERLGFAYGAAFLMLKDYFTDIGALAKNTLST